MRKISWLLVTALLASLPTLAFAAGAIDGGTKQAVNWVAIGMFVAFVALTLGITYWAAKRTVSAADFYSAGGGITGLPERPRDRRRLHVGGLVPGHLGPCLHLRLRWL